MKNSLKLILPIFLSLSACQQKLTDDKVLSHYTSETMQIDGEMNEQVWKEASIYTLDTYFNATKDSDKQKTVFRAAWKEDTIYFHFTCEDPYICAKELRRDGAPFLDDCAEVFISPSAINTSMHFCYEVNILKTINDIVYIDDCLGEGPGVIKGYNPDVRIGVSIDGTMNDNSDIDKGWTMEMAIPMMAFNRLSEFYPIQEGTQWRMLAIRQNRDIIDSEDRVSSVNFVLDTSAGMDVHQSDRFGLIEFVK